MNLLSTLKTYKLKGFLGANICIMVYCVKWLVIRHSIFIWFFLNRKEKLLRVFFECSSCKANFLSPFLKISLKDIFRSRLENTCDTWRDVTEWQLRDIWWSPPSIPQTSDNDTMSSQIPSYIITEARPRPGQKISTPWSGTLPTRSEAPTASNSHVFIQVVRVRWFITIANNANIYPRLPGRWLVCWCWPLWACLTARMTDCFLPPSSKQRREKLLFVQSLAGFLDRYSN